MSPLQTPSGQGPTDLSEGTVHLAIIDTGAYRPGLEEVLTAEEMRRAGAFHFEPDRVLYITARAGLRTVLGRFLGQPPHQVSLVVDPGGKPRLDGAAASAVEFNVSHSGSRAVIAVTLGTPVGIDVEEVRHDVPYLAMAMRSFSPLELDALGACPPERQIQRFYEVWTRKEAFLKATGTGLGTPPETITVATDLGRPAPVSDTSGELGWWTGRVETGKGYEAALAMPIDTWELIRIQVDLGG